MVEDKEQEVVKKETQAAATAETEQPAAQPEVTEAASEVDAEAQLQDAKEEYQEKLRKQQDAANSPYQDYAGRTRLEDQKRYLSESLVVGEEAVAFAKIDMDEYKQRTLDEMDREKAAYIEMLDKQEKAILEDANMRVFAKIDEGPEAETLAEQRKYLNEEIAKKRTPVSIQLMLKASEPAKEA